MSQSPEETPAQEDRGPARAARRSAVGSYCAALVAVVLALLPMSGAAQDAPWQQGPLDSAIPVPFGPGERMDYEAKLGRLSVGEGQMIVHGIERVRGHRTYHLTMAIRGGIPLARVDDRMDSWLDVTRLSTRRFAQRLRQVRYRRDRQWEIYPEERRWEQSNPEVAEDMVTDLPLDDVSFVYYVRSLPLEVGDRYVLDRYYQEHGNPVIIDVVRRDTVEVPAGTFETIVVRPTIKTSGLFGEGGEAEIHFSDDDRRIMILLESRVPVVGSLSLHLTEYTPGRPLRRWRASTLEEEAERYRAAARDHAEQDGPGGPGRRE